MARHRLAPDGGRLSESVSAFLGMDTTDVLGSYIVEGPPIAQERIGRPLPGSFNYIRGSACNEELGRPSNSEAVSCSTWVAQWVPDLVAMLKEKGLCKRRKTVSGCVRKEMSIKWNVVDTKVFGEQGDGVNRSALIN